MKKLLTIGLSIGVGFLLAILVREPHRVAAGGVEKCSAKNGDVNADTKVDLSDAVTVLSHLFQGNPTSLPPLCAAPGPSSGLPATGQDVCWNYDPEQGIFVEVPCNTASCAGQDGSLAVGCSSGGRFTDNGDGTLTDKCTGLMWQQSTADVSGDGQIEPLGDTLAWCEAVSFCEGLIFAGHDDWRLPNARELQSIVDYGRVDLAIHPAFEGLAQYYWSSTSFAQTPNDAFGVGFNSGYVGVRTKQGDLDFSFNFVRAVRTGP